MAEGMLQKWGNSQGIRIPKHLVNAVHWAQGEKLDIKAEGTRLIIEPKEKRKTIDELFEGYDGEYSEEYVDWGSPRGNEVW